MSKFLDTNGLLYFWGKVKLVLAAKVDKVEGKQLSTNDYTTAEKTKLAGLGSYTHPTGDGNSHVPATGTGNSGKLLRAGAAAGSAAWGSLEKADVTGALGYEPPKQDTVYAHPTGAGNEHIPAGGSSGQILRWNAAGKAAWGVENNTTYANMTGATASAAGAAGLVPAPAMAQQGLFLKGDGTWGTPTNTTYAAVTTSVSGLMLATDKVKLDAFQAAGSYALKTDITGVYKYKGSKATVAALPTTGNIAGDVWDVTADGMNYAWTGTAWDALGAAFTIDAITNAEIDTMMAS